MINSKAFLLATLASITLLGWVFWKTEAPLPVLQPVEEIPERAAVSPVVPSPLASVITLENTAKPHLKNIRYGPVKLSANETRSNRHRHTQACDSSAQPLREIPSGGIVKWTDENGITHYENFQGEAQPDDKTLVVRSPHTKDYFSLDIQFPPGGQAPFSTSDIQQKATGVYEVYRKWLDDRWLSRAEIRLLFYADQEKFAAHRGQFVTQGSSYIAGFYLPQENQAVILYQGSKDATFGVMVHEIAHIINHQVFGDLPRWLNEGLATHIQYLEKGGSKINLSNSQLKNLKAFTKSQVINSVSVAELLATTHNDWQSDNLATYYQLSQTLTHFLLLPKNRDSMLPIFSLLAQSKCSNRDLERIIDEHYEGGISTLSDNFNRWLDS